MLTLSGDVLREPTTPRITNDLAMRKIAFVHYHLNTGGVTTVLRQQVQALQDHAQCLVLTGPTPATDMPVAHVVVEGLGYDDPRTKYRIPARIAQEIDNTIRDHFGGPCDLLHVHNPTLSKNRNLPEILEWLQAKQVRLFLQIHDFSEDGRPHAYYQHQPYLRDCHYGVINTRDRHLLLKAGLVPRGLHLLPNMVHPRTPGPDTGAPQNRILYPVRAIRRKNIGEALLLSRFFPDQAGLAITLPPTSAADQTAYETWKGYACDRRLPVQFDVGLENNFQHLLQTARFVISTSISEGFGFSFLEPWGAGKYLAGRLLTDTCADFRAKGLRLKHLYREVRIPMQWIGVARLERRFTTALSRGRVLFGQPLSAADLQQRIAPLLAGDTIDLGLLSEDLQQHILDRLLDDPGAPRALVRRNPWLPTLGKGQADHGLIEHNRRVVSDHYGPAPYLQSLLKTYRRVMATPVRHQIDSAKLLDAFSRPPYLSLLKWEAVAHARDL